MKPSIHKRLAALENRSPLMRRHKIAIVIYDAAIFDALKDIKFDADTVLFLPDNRHDLDIPSNGYIVRYS